MTARSFSGTLPFCSASAAASAEGGAGTCGNRLWTSAMAWK